MGFAGFVIWCALLAAAGLAFPRRPQLSGFLFIALGVWSVILRLWPDSHMTPSVFLSTITWFAIGSRQLMRQAC